jgi:hypothetical protein
MKKYSLHTTRLESPRVSDAHMIYAENDMEAVWQSYIIQMERLDQASCKKYDLALTTVNNMSAEFEVKSIWNHNFRTYKFSHIEQELMNRHLVNKSYTPKELKKLLNYSREKHEDSVHALSRYVFEYLWNSNFPDTVAIINPESRIMMMFQLMTDFVDMLIRDFKSVNAETEHIVHMLITPISDSNFDEHEMQSIDNAFQMWEQFSDIYNVSVYDLTDQHAIVTFSVRGQPLIIQNMRYWFDRHDIQCDIKGLATTLFYDYIEFESDYKTNITKFTHEPAVGTGELIERNTKSRLYPVLKTYYDSES